MYMKNENDFVLKVLLVRLLGMDGIKLEVGDLNSERVRTAFDQMFKQISLLRSKLEPKNIMTRSRFIEEVIIKNKQYQFTIKEKLLLRTLAPKKMGVEREEIIKRVRTKNIDSLKVLKHTLDTKLNKHKLNHIIKIAGLGRKVSGYKMEITTNLLGYSIK